MIQDFAKVFVVFGIILIIVGGFLWILGKVPFVGRLPGDILIKKDNFTFYAPIATSILLSIILSILITIFFNLRK